jgi:hypothetical protein
MATGDSTLVKTFTCHPGWGGLKKAFFTHTVTGTYLEGATDGYACDLTKFGLGTLRMVYLPPTVSGYVPVYNETTKRLEYYYADNNAAGDSALIQVANGVNIGSLVCKICAEGTGT